MPPSQQNAACHGSMRMLTEPAVAQMTWPTALASPCMMVPEYTCTARLSFVLL